MAHVKNNFSRIVAFFLLGANLRAWGLGKMGAGGKRAKRRALLLVFLAGIAAIPSAIGQIVLSMEKWVSSTAPAAPAAP